MQITTNNLKLILFAIAILCLVTVAAIVGSGCGDGDDDNCQATTGCSNADAGMMTADADPVAPDADTTPDGNTYACAEFDQPSPAGLTWDCTGEYNLQCKNPRFVTDSNECYAACDNITGVGQVQSSDQTSVWHNFTVTMQNSHSTCRPLF